MRLSWDYSTSFVQLSRISHHYYFVHRMKKAIGLNIRRTRFYIRTFALTKTRHLPMLKIILLLLSLSLINIYKSFCQEKNQAISHITYTFEEVPDKEAADVNISSDFKVPMFILELIEEEFHEFDITPTLNFYALAGSSSIEIKGFDFSTSDILVSIFSADERVRFSPVYKGKTLVVNFTQEPKGEYYLILENLKLKSIAKFKITKTR